MKVVRYLQYIYGKFGWRAIYFLLASKFKKDRTGPWKIKGVSRPISLSNFSCDVTTLFQVFFSREYELDIKKPPEFILDCGANIGLSTVYFAEKFPEATIVAVEPDVQNFRFLLENTRFYKNVYPIQKAIWSKAIPLSVIDSGLGSWNLQTKPALPDQDNSVDGITISQIMNEFRRTRIDILKMDIEGAEKELFQNDYQEWIHKISVLTIELHAFMDPSIPEVVYNALQPYRFKSDRNGENQIFYFSHI